MILGGCHEVNVLTGILSVNSYQQTRSQTPLEVLSVFRRSCSSSAIWPWWCTSIGGFRWQPVWCQLGDDIPYIAKATGPRGPGADVVSGLGEALGLPAGWAPAQDRAEGVPGIVTGMLVALALAIGRDGAAAVHGGVVGVRRPDPTRRLASPGYFYNLDVLQPAIKCQGICPMTRLSC